MIYVFEVPVLKICQLFKEGIWKKPDPCFIRAVIVRNFILYVHLLNRIK